MSTVVRRIVRSSPYRDAAQTWDIIVELLTQGKEGSPRNELRAVTGIAASIIADQAPKSASIIATCNGPRTRIYCIYNDDAIDGSDANEDPLGFEPLKGDWAVSLPCSNEDLDWVTAGLKKHSSRITARDSTLGIAVEEASAEEQALTLDLGEFLKL